jgi:intracellular sulfur oxidation DsrE/DsrF family protein
MGQGQRFAVDRITGLAVRNRERDRPAVELHAEFVIAGNGVRAVKTPANRRAWKARETERQRVPAAAQRRHVQAVRGIGVEVEQVGQHRVGPVARGASVSPASAAAAAKLLAESVESWTVSAVHIQHPLAHVRREAVGQGCDREHRIRLLAHAMAIDVQRMVVQQQRELVRRGVVDRPGLLAEEGVILREDLSGFVERQEDRVGGAQHGLPLTGGKPGSMPWRSSSKAA